MYDPTSVLKKALVGEQLSAVSFVMDYVEFQFDGVVLTAFTDPRAELTDPATTHYRDQLCALIMATVTDAWEVERTCIVVTFGDKGRLVVPLDEDSKHQVEAAQLVSRGKTLALW
jgi:hypothetical protein